MKIAVLDCTLENVELLDGLTTAGQKIADWLSPALPEAAFARIGVADGAPLPDPHDFDGIIVGGSEFGVYDDMPWMPPLRAYLLRLRELGIPVYGICFGHQIMADVYGGRAEKAAHSVVVGARDIETGEGTIRAHFWHKDQVTAQPPNTTVTARTAHCPIGALSYDFPAKSVQFHPELEELDLTEIFDRGRGLIIDPDDADAAVQTFGRPLDNASVANEAAAFFRTALGQVALARSGT